MQAAGKGRALSAKPGGLFLEKLKTKSKIALCGKQYVNCLKCVERIIRFYEVGHLTEGYTRAIGKPLFKIVGDTYYSSELNFTNNLTLSAVFKLCLRRI